VLLSIVLAVVQVNPQIGAAYGVLARTVGARAEEFDLRLMPATGKRDKFSLQAKNGRVRIEGTSGVAICRGAYEYLKDKCNSFVSWEGSNINLPKRFPDQPRREISCPVTFRHYYNICTFGYTTAFWDWKRWEREIDWMALHGINMPLAMTGQDKVWQTVFKSFGVPQSSLDHFFSGPAFQPWHWMGNLNGHGGPTPQSWLDGQAALQNKILERERSLGMVPIVPGFSGFVPTDFSKFQPKVKLQSPTAWAGFEPTTFVDIRDPMFIEIGKRFVQEYRKEFGSDHFYLCDTFNEQNPQFPEATKLDDLANAGRAVYEGLRQGDPDAVWMMQGWLFYNERNYWHAPEVEALLSKVPNEKMIILDLSCEQFEVWRAQPVVAKKGFIYNTLHNFGQNTGLGGALQTYVDKAFAAQSSLQSTVPKANLVGFGLTPEGIDQNPIVYELMTDAMWTSKPIKVEEWLDGFCRARYGVSPLMSIPHVGPEWTAKIIARQKAWKTMRVAWQSLLEGVYSKDTPWYHDSWRSRPGRSRRGRPVAQMRKLEAAMKAMLSVSSELGKNPLYQRDLVDVCKTWLGGIADRQALSAIQTWKDKPSEYAIHRIDFFQVLEDIDRVMACRPEHRLSTWIQQARSWGKTPAEKALMERNARLQVTAWDTKGVLTDYANKEWAGLTLDFLAKRWDLYFASLEGAPKPDYLKMELGWMDSTKPPRESEPGDAANTVSAVFGAHHGELENLEAALGGWEPVGNIAKAGKASDDGHTEPGGGPQNAIDGDMETFWAASPSPCQWRLDLGSTRTIKTIEVFPFWGDGRIYQYTVQSSADGVNWNTIVDMSKNTLESSMSGHKHVLSQPVGARYLRIDMLKNSANIGVHLVEVRVYEM
jgi:alpha-N-acetylglucosaminidase